MHPTGFGGEPELREGLSSFFNKHFYPFLPVEADHISVTAGSGNSLDALFQTICDEGDIILTPGPFWGGFSIYAAISSVIILPSPAPSFRNSLTSQCVDRLIATYDACPDQSRIKALLICNPHNPSYDTYSPETLRKLMNFCHERNLLYVSDEAGSLTTFNTDFEKPFTSALSLVRSEEGHGINSSRVHVVWSTSKDFGSPGMRLGCVVSQANPSLIAGVTYSSLWQVSILSSIYLTAVLTSPKLSNLIALNKKRLRNAYELLTTTLKEWNMEYIPVKAGVMIFVKVARDAKSLEEEAATVAKLREAGVFISAAGRIYPIDGEMGWAAILFAMKVEVMKEALARMKKGFDIGRWR